MSSVRAKFYVHLKDGGMVRLVPVGPKYDEKTQQYVPDAENSKFWEATPCGELWMSITNKDAVEALELGKEYYLDLTPVD